MSTSPDDNATTGNHRLLVQFYDAVERGDLGFALDPVSDDVEWRVHRPAPSAGRYHGKQEVLDWAQESAERPAPVSYTGVQAWQFTEGKISRFESYYDESYTELVESVELGRRSTPARVNAPSSAQPRRRRRRRWRASKPRPPEAARGPRRP